MRPQSNKSSVVLVSGPSGAGRSTAINAFEDLGFEAIDNLPLDLLPRLLSGPPAPRPMALGIDVRTRDFSVRGVLDMLDHINQSDSFEATLLYLDCSLDVLVKRYSETRRRHPLAPGGSPIEGIREEIALLDSLRSRADMLIDTSEQTPHELRGEINAHFGDEKGALLAVNLQSFSYKRGVPRGVDMAMDCRFLNNPYWDENLREFCGLDQPIKDFVKKDKNYQPFFDRLSDLVQLLLPAYREEGKAHFSIGLGCTGGQHRSVCVTEELATFLISQGWRVSIRHRELERRGRV